MVQSEFLAICFSQRYFFGSFRIEIGSATFPVDGQRTNHKNYRKYSTFSIVNQLERSSKTFFWSELCSRIKTWSTNANQMSWTFPLNSVFLRISQMQKILTYNFYAERRSSRSQNICKRYSKQKNYRRIEIPIWFCPLWLCFTFFLHSIFSLALETSNKLNLVVVS